MAVLPLLLVACWHQVGLAQPATATPQEAANVQEFQVLQSQKVLTSLRRLTMEYGTIELLLHPQTNAHYVVVTSTRGEVRRVVKADNERAALLSFDSFRRLAAQGEAGRPVLMGESLNTVGGGMVTAGRGDDGATEVTALDRKGPVAAAARPPAPTPAPTPTPTPMPVTEPTMASLSSRTPAAMLITPPIAPPTARPAAQREAQASEVSPTKAASMGAPPIRSPLMAEAERLQAAGRLTGMRRTENGDYNAALMFHADTARYFVVLSHQSETWRVVQTLDSGQALRTYDEFASQSATLAADDIRRLELKAQTEAAQRELQAAQAQARQMAEDLEADRRYRAMIQAQESQNRSDVAELQQQRQQVQEQLLAEQRRLMELRRQLDPSVGAAGGAVPVPRKGSECRFAKPGQPVPAAERHLPLCGVDGRPRP